MLFSEGLSTQIEFSPNEARMFLTSFAQIAENLKLHKSVEITNPICPTLLPCILFLHNYIFNFAFMIIITITIIIMIIITILTIIINLILMEIISRTKARSLLLQSPLPHRVISSKILNPTMFSSYHHRFIIIIIIFVESQHIAAAAAY